MPDQFVALGGGDTIGNSCYYLEIVQDVERKGQNILWKSLFCAGS